MNYNMLQEVNSTDCWDVKSHTTLAVTGKDPEIEMKK